MTPNPGKVRWNRRQVYDPAPGSVSPLQLVRMSHRKKKHLSDWAVGALMLAIQAGNISKKQADIFQSVFVRGANIRKIRKHSGRPFLGPGGEIMTIKGVEYAGGDGADDSTPRLALEDVASHPRYKTWKEEWFTGTKQAEGWSSEEADSSDHDGDGDDKGDGNEVPPKKKAKRKAKSEVTADSDAEEGLTPKEREGKRAAKKFNAAGHPTTARKGPSSSGRPTMGMKNPVVAPASVPVGEGAAKVEGAAGPADDFDDGGETAATQEGPSEPGAGGDSGGDSDALSSLSESQFRGMEQEIEQGVREEVDIPQDDPEDSDYVPGSGRRSGAKARGKRGGRK